LRDDGTEPVRVGARISFVDRDDEPVTFSTLRVNAYDIDREQFVEFTNVSSYSLTEGTIVTPTLVSAENKHYRFTASSAGASTSPEEDEVHSYGEARVEVNYEMVSEIVVTFGAFGNASQLLDFRDVGYGWTLANGTELPSSPTPTSGSRPNRESSNTQPAPTVAKPNRAVLISGGFEHNSRKLTPKMKRKIDRWLAKHPHLKTVTCTGFTSLPRRTSDVKLSTNRGKTACKYAKSKRPELTTSVSQGKEDPRPGSTVRRVRLVLTP
jgi:hypothetical protein